MPLVQKHLKEFFDGKELNTSLIRGETVASGAAMHAAKLTHGYHLDAPLLLNATAISLGVEKDGGEMDTILERNCTIPCKEKRPFVVNEDNKTDAIIRVYEGEKKMAEDNHLLDVFRLSGLGPLPSDEPQIYVTFDIDANDNLEVWIENKHTGMSEKMCMENTEEYLPHKGLHSFKPMSAMANDSRPAPSVIWAQRPGKIYLTINLENCKIPEIAIEKDKLIFVGKGGTENKEYAVTIPFYKEIDPENSKYVSLVRNIPFVLMKGEEGPFWPRLLKEAGKNHWLKTDFDKWHDEDDSDVDDDGDRNFEDMMK